MVLSYWYMYRGYRYGTIILVLVYRLSLWYYHTGTCIQVISMVLWSWHFYTGYLYGTLMLVLVYRLSLWYFHAGTCIEVISMVLWFWYLYRGYLYGTIRLVLLEVIFKIEYHTVGDIWCQPLLSHGNCVWLIDVNDVQNSRWKKVEAETFYCHSWFKCCIVFVMGFVILAIYFRL